MKKFHFILAAIFILFFAVVFIISPSEVVSQKKIDQTTQSIPDSVATILKNSCVSCHGAGGNGMAMSMWNFSAWDTYPAKKQTKKANAICNAITNGSMPPSSVRNSSPDRVPTTAQKDIVCKWASSLQVK